MINIAKLRKTVDGVYNADENKTWRQDQNRYLKYYTGTYWKDQERNNKAESGIYANYIFSTVMTTAPLLTDNEPTWGITARKPYMQKLADRYKDVGDCLWPVLDMDRKIFDWVLDSLILEIGIAKVFFNPDNGPFGELEVNIIDPREFVMAPGYTDPWESPWCGIVTRKPMDWIRNRYPDTWENVKPDEGGAEKREVDREYSEDSADFELCSEMATIYEIWMRDSEVEDYFETERDEKGEEKKVKKSKPKYPNGRVVVFTRGYDQPLEDKAYPYTHGKPPYVALYDYKIPHHFRGMGEARQIETLVLEFNKNLKKIAKYVNLWADPNFYGSAGNGIDPDKWKKEAPGGGNYWAINEGATPPTAVAMPAINSTCTEFTASIPRLIEEVSGVTDISKGMISKKQRQSAREIEALVETSYTRTRQRVRNLEWSIKRLYTLIVEIMQQYYTEQRTYSKKTETGKQWVSISNSKEFAQEVTAPTPDEKIEEANSLGIDIPNDQAQEQQDYDDLMAYIGDEDSVYVPFDITVETNSTLPLDKQAMANLFLRLAEVQITPQSAVDVQSLLEMLRVPKTEQIIERLQAAQQSQQPPGPPGMPPGMPPGAPPQGGM